VNKTLWNNLTASADIFSSRMVRWVRLHASPSSLAFLQLLLKLWRYVSLCGVASSRISLQMDACRASKYFNLMEDTDRPFTDT